MADKLPLLPEKDAVCADVNSVLQEVFRESNYLPKLDAGKSDWIDKLSDDNKILHKQELKLRDEYAKRLSKEPFINIYKLHSPRISRYDSRSKWKKDVGLIERKDLKPTIKQDASGDNNLWVKNILNRSSGNLATIKVTGSKTHPPAQIQISEDSSLQSISWGQVIPKPPVALLPSSSVTPIPDYIICIPSQLKFINFNIGRLHTHTLRLINVSKFEMRLSVRPPKRRELDVQLCSRLTVTSGSAAEIKIHFRPKDVRVLSDQLLVRVSSGQTLIIPIVCYMEPPTLDIIFPPGGLQLSSPESINTVSDVLDLGARLLGDVHKTSLILKCGERHSSFFLLSEDAWLEYSVEVATGIMNNITMYGVVADCFFVTPARWSGGGSVHGFAVCRADTSGLHTAMLRILCSTAIVRPLHLMADALMFSPKHITLKAQEKDYDICSEDDPACEYYVNLGISFPNDSLTATVTIFNHSPLSYNYYWSVRPWGVCSCWNPSYRSQDGEDCDDDLCPGALHAKLETNNETNDKHGKEEPSLAVLVEQARGCLEPRSDTAVCVRVPDVGGTPGLRRAVLMLILTDIPKVSFPENYDPMIVSVNVVNEGAIPGVSTNWSREVCELVCAQMEVWWDVVPVRFALDPPLLLLPHSRRVKSMAIKLRATQLYGISSVKARFEMTTPAPAPPRLMPGHSYYTSAILPLKELPNEFPEMSYIRLKSESSSWSVSCGVSRWCSERAPGLRPSCSWLGVVSPGVTVKTTIDVLNDTHQYIYWWGTCHRWYRERVVSRACQGRPPCADCCSRTCTCLLLTPSRGALPHTHRVTLHYQATAPDSDGCVSTLVQVERTAADTSSVSSVRGSASRAALVSYRVLAPRLTLTVLPCGGDKRAECIGCALDSSTSAVLRPKFPLTVGDTSCCRLRITNITPIPTRVTWEPSIEEKEALRVVFIPNEFKLGGYSQIIIMVTLEAGSVISRRQFVRRAHVVDAYKPLYLLIDAAISGVEVSVEFPIGGGEHTDSFVSIKMMQKATNVNISTKKPLSLSVTDLFAEQDRKRALQKVHTCTCKYEMVYIEPKKEPLPPKQDDDDSPKIEIVESPPPLTRVCPCSGQCKPRLPEDMEPYCIQFVNLPLRKVRSRSVTLSNSCRLNARWSCAVRRHERPYMRTIHTREQDQWSEAVRPPGYILSCSPSSGILVATSSVTFTVSVFADTWGLYFDQILIQVEELEPLVIDVWVEAVGSPLSFVLRTQQSREPVLWISHSDTPRLLNITNTSRADLIVYPYIVKDNEYPQQELPFRLYMRLFDILPRVCPCLSAFSSRSLMEEEDLEESLVIEEMDTDVELFLTADFGTQDESFFQVEPPELCIKAGESVTMTVRLLPRHEVAPYTTLLLRSLPVTKFGDTWYRPPPPVQCVSLREAERHSDLRITSSEIRVTLCALDLPFDDVMRVRKRVKVQNIGEGPLETTAKTERPWRLGLSRSICKAHCIDSDTTKSENIEFQIPPTSCIEMVVELCLKTKDIWPKMDCGYPPRTITSTALCFFNQEVMLLSLPLVLDMDLPVLMTEPEIIDFGYVSDNTSRKSYFTVKHSSASATIELVTSWSGDDQFRLWPSSLRLRPGVSERVYVQFIANWMEGAVSSGEAVISHRGAGGEWCRGVVRIRACVARTTSHIHDDHTDDVILLHTS